MNRSVAIANEFLRKAGAAGLTQMQLQKLVYFSHGWNLALSNEPLTSDQPEAWDYGPVYPDLYDHTKYFGRSEITRQITPDDDEAARFFLGGKRTSPPYRAELSGREQQIINHVWSRYGQLTGARLSALTHQPDTPWAAVYGDGVGKSRKIPNDIIDRHYKLIAIRAQAAAN